MPVLGSARGELPSRSWNSRMLIVPNVRKYKITIHIFLEIKFPKSSDFVRYTVFDQVTHHVSVVNVNGTDGTDLLTVPLGKVSNQQVDQGNELCGLFLVVVLQRVLVTFFQPAERYFYLGY